jgi:hypothetical protein
MRRRSSILKTAIPARPALRLPGSAARLPANPLIHADPAVATEAYARNAPFEPENSRTRFHPTAAARVGIANAMMAST